MPHRHSSALRGYRLRRSSPSCRGGASSLLRIVPAAPRFANGAALPMWIDRAMRLSSQAAAQHGD